MLSKALKDLSQIKSKHDEIVTIYENILGYLSSDKCDIKELDHQKLEDLSCFLLKGLNLFTDLSDHIVCLQKQSLSSTSSKYLVPKGRRNKGKLRNYFVFRTYLSPYHTSGPNGVKVFCANLSMVTQSA